MTRAPSPHLSGAQRRQRSPRAELVASESLPRPRPLSDPAPVPALVPPLFGSPRPAWAVGCGLWGIPSCSPLSLWKLPEIVLREDTALLLRRGCGGAASACVTGGARAASGWKGCKMTNEEPLPKKVRLSETDFKVMARDELILRWKQYEAYVQALEGKYTDLNCKFDLPK
ncbi:hypothetical protein NN561_006330 [Cricetulus griseus]